MRGLRFIPADINISFIPKRIMFFIFSAVLITSSVGLFLTKGLNYGIDFQGGILMEVRTDKAASISAMPTGCNADKALFLLAPQRGSTRGSDSSRGPAPAV